MSSPSIHKPISCPECGHEMRRVWTEQIQTAIDEFRSETVVAWPHLVCDQCQFKCGIDYDETWSPMQSTILMLSTTIRWDIVGSMMNLNLRPRRSLRTTRARSHQRIQAQRFRVRRLRCRSNQRRVHPNIVASWICGCGASDEINGRTS
jgi:hypothetical protein